MVFEGVPKLIFEFNHLKTFFLFINENIGSSFGKYSVLKRYWIIRIASEKEFISN